MIKSKPKKQNKRRKNPDNSSSMIALSLENVQKTRKRLDESEILLEQILNYPDLTEQDFRKMNDEVYFSDNPVYELYQQYRTVLAEANVVVEQTKYILEIMEGYRLGKPKKKQILQNSLSVV